MLSLPQILLSAVLAVKSLASPVVWVGAARRGWETLRARPVRGVGWLAASAGGVVLAWWLLQPVPTEQLERPIVRPELVPQLEPLLVRLEPLLQVEQLQLQVEPRCLDFDFRQP